MKKYVAVYADGHTEAFWSIDLNMAKFHAKDGVRLHGRVVSVKPLQKAA